MNQINFFFKFSLIEDFRIKITRQERQNEDTDTGNLSQDATHLILFDIEFIDGRHLNFVRFVADLRFFTRHGQFEKSLFDGRTELFEFLVTRRAEFQQLGYLQQSVLFHFNLDFYQYNRLIKTYVRRVLDGNAEFAQIATEFFDTVVIALDGVSGELLQSTGQSLGFGHLTRSNSRTLFVENVLDFDCKYFTVLVELLST